MQYSTIYLQSFNFQWPLTMVRWKNVLNVIPWLTQQPPQVFIVENHPLQATSWWCRWAKNRFACHQTPNWYQTTLMTLYIYLVGIWKSRKYSRPPLRPRVLSNQQSQNCRLNETHLLLHQCCFFFTYITKPRFECYSNNPIVSHVLSYLSIYIPSQSVFWATQSCRPDNWSCVIEKEILICINEKTKVLIFMSYLLSIENESQKCDGTKQYFIHFFSILFDTKDWL